MIRKLLLGIVLNTLALYAVTQIVTEVSYTGGIVVLITAGVLIGFLNAFVKPIMKIFSFPLVFLTGGLFLIVINAFLLWFTNFVFDILAIENFDLVIAGIKNYAFAGAVFGIVNWFAHWLVKN